MTPIRWLLTGLLCLIPAGCSFTRGTVTRIESGIEREGHAISAEAYATYARGVELEARGDRNGAILAFESAAREDPESAEILARLGALYCARSESAGDHAQDLAEQRFKGALELDAYSSHTWAAIARCSAHRARAHEALQAARQAANYDPTSVELSLLVVEYAEALGDLPTARRWLDGILASAPGSREALQALKAFGVRHAEPARQLRAQRELDALGAGDAKLALERALDQDDLERARSARERLRMAPSELAIQALGRGALSVAHAEAALAWAADPSDADAWVVALVVADLTRNRAEFEALLLSPPTPAAVPKPATLAVFRDLLGRTLGAEARAAWVGASE